MLLEQAGVHAYKEALYLSVGIGGALFAVNEKIAPVKKIIGEIKLKLTFHS